MFSRKFIALVFCAVGLSVLSYASVFDGEKTVDVVVKSIAVGQKIKIRSQVQEEEQESVTLSFCRSSAETSSQALIHDPNMNLIRKAMKNGRPLRVSYSLFDDNCITAVTSQL